MYKEITIKYGSDFFDKAVDEFKIIEQDGLGLSLPTLYNAKEDECAVLIFDFVTKNKNIQQELNNDNSDSIDYLILRFKDGSIENICVGEHMFYMQCKFSNIGFINEILMIEFKSLPIVSPSFAGKPAEIPIVVDLQNKSMYFLK